MKQDKEKKGETINSFHIEQGSNKVQEILNFFHLAGGKKKYIYMG